MQPNAHAFLPLSQAKNSCTQHFPHTKKYGDNVHTLSPTLKNMGYREVTPHTTKKNNLFHETSDFTKVGIY